MDVLSSMRTKKKKKKKNNASFFSFLFFLKLTTIEMRHHPNQTIRNPTRPNQGKDQGASPNELHKDFTNTLL